MIWFDDAQRERVAIYLATQARDYLPALEATTDLIDGFESPLGMELLATVDWLVHHDNVPSSLVEIKKAIGTWSGGAPAAARKKKLFDDRLLELALKQLH